MDFVVKIAAVDWGDKFNVAEDNTSGCERQHDGATGYS